MRSTMTPFLLLAALALPIGAGALDAAGEPADVAEPTPTATASVDAAPNGTQGLIASGERLVYVPLAEPCRLFDLRSGQFNVGSRSQPLRTAETIVLDAHGTNGQCVGIPNGAEALALNVTALDATVETFVTVWASGTRPNASSLNPAPGQPPVPNAVVTGLDASGRFRVYNNAGSVNVLADIVGYYEDHHHDDRYDTSAEVSSKISASVGQVLNTPDGAPTQGRPLHGADVLAGVDTATDTQIAVGPFGQTVISHVNRIGEPTVLRCADPRCATVNPLTSFGAANSVVAILEMVIDPNGDPAFLVGRTTGDLDYVTCLSFCVGGSSYTVTTTGSNADVTFNAAGNPVFAYESQGTQVVQGSICLDPTCSSSILVDLVPQTSGRAGAEVAMRSWGAPVFAVARSTSSGIDVVSCGDADCTTALIERHTVETGRTPLPDSLSMVLTSDGAPVISFVDAATLATVVVLCAEELCSVDVASFVAADSGTIDTEVAIDGAGLVTVLIERSSAPAGSSLVRCTDRNCSQPLVTVPLGGSTGDRTTDLAINHQGVPVMSGVTATDLVSIEQVSGDSHVAGGGS